MNGLQPTTVLTVDDNPLMAEAAAGWFGRNSEFRHAGHFLSGEGVLQAVQERNVDLVLMDLEMPGTDTFALVEQIADKCTECRVLMLSGHCRGNDIMNCLASGAKGYVLKHHEPAFILDAVRAVASGESFLCDEAALAVGLPVRPLA
jgi:DNA-binding NarL/FixJ family response regulator